MFKHTEVKINALRIAGHLLSSCDTQAWSATARHEHIRLPECRHLSRPDPVTGRRVATDCRNCFRYAVRYREEVMDALRQAGTPRQDKDAPAMAACPPVPTRRRLVGRVRTTRRAAPLPDQLALFGP
ncbi:hypothetical protein GCM10023170_017700 [Phytohabitans houttuyneae]|uniref:Uncharacterized protein n=1 Tax=Phytohabitans houttuyneae TaxID=1076126 RepID=A0A6V8KZ56_9ACTN|nr:hypothetical protein Phou_099750 [Phytohabitans houttuyneae]